MKLFAQDQMAVNGNLASECVSSLLASDSSLVSVTVEPYRGSCCTFFNGLEPLGHLRFSEPLGVSELNLTYNYVV